MKFPLPELKNTQFTICQEPKADAPRGAYRHQYFWDDGHCCACDEVYVRTCRIQGMPNLCKECYSWMRKYSQMDDPYKIKRIREGTPIEPEQIKKAIRYAKVKTMDVAGVTGMTTGTILLHAYKEYKQALDEGSSEEEARARQAYIEQQEELRIQAEQEEEARQEEHRQELLRKMRENQRILDAQQARLNRLSGKNTMNNSSGVAETKKQEVVKAAEVKEVPKQVVQEEKKEAKKRSYPKWKIVLGIILVICCAQEIMILAVILVGIIVFYYLKARIEEFRGKK